MRAEGDAVSFVQMLVDQDATFGERDAQMRRLDLKGSAFKGDGVVVAHGAFLLDGENQVKIDVRLNWNKSGSRLLGFDSEATVKSVDVDFF